MASDFRLKEQLPRLTEQIVETYTGIGTINHLGHSPLPNREVIVSVIEDLKEVIYPGYRRREGLHLGNITYHVGDLIDGLHDKLTSQIARALRHEERVHDTDDPAEPTDYDAKGQAMRFLGGVINDPKVQRARGRTGQMELEFARRYVNDGFSGGEMKRAEILQLAMLQPKFAIDRASFFTT